MLIRQSPTYYQDYICVNHEIGEKLQKRSIMPLFMDSKGFYFDKKYKSIIEVVKKE